jgi:hypothetical protein
VPYAKRRTEILKPVSITSATGWMATITGEGRGRPVVVWALLTDGEIVGLVDDGGGWVPAENVLNFTGYQKTQ